MPHSVIAEDVYKGYRIPAGNYSFTASGQLHFIIYFCGILAGATVFPNVWSGMAILSWSYHRVN